MISYNEAIQKIIEISTPLQNECYVNTTEAVGLVSKEDILCKKDLPAFNNAAMDGYAFKFSEKNSSLSIKQTIFAGDTPSPILGINECYKIMTGALVPNDADTIVPFEQSVQIDENSIKVSSSIKLHNAFRFKGEEQSVGNILIPKGTLLEPSHIMLLASQGIMQVLVHVKPKIAIISTGDEIKEPWQSADTNSIYNCNGFGIQSVLKKFGFSSSYCGVVPDNLKKSTKFFAHLKQRYDVIISSGGISMGEADFVKEALRNNGFKEAFHGVRIKPGRPTMAGVMDNTLVLALPGNPMAAFLNTYLFALLALRSKSNHPYQKSFTCKALNKKAFSFKPKRTNIILGKFHEGYFLVTRDNKFGSGMITPITESNAISLSPESSCEYKANEEIEIIML